MTSVDSVSGFYKDQCILLTGGSGFLGKVILEKLLRDCRGISNVYVLLRSKQGIDPRRRVEEMTNSIAFSRIRRENPALFQKIIPVSGDITYEGLGLSPADERILTERVSVVFHVAATIRFDEPLRLVITDLSRQSSQLPSSVFISRTLSDRRDGIHCFAS